MATSGGRRDLQDLRTGFSAWCEVHRPDIVAFGIEELTHASAGWSNETIIVTYRSGRDDGATEKCVLRLPPKLATFPDLDLTVQAAVQNAVAAQGVPTAEPVLVEEDPTWVGAPFLVMPFAHGTIPGEASLFDPWLTEATPTQRRAAQQEMVRVLTDIAAIDWRATGFGEWLIGSSGGLDEQLDYWDRYLRWAMGDVSMPRIEAIAGWCRKHRPTGDVPLSLVWGDPRLGNLVVGDDRRTRAVLDWELATIGPAEMDLGWYLGLERVLHELTGQEPLDGFASPDEVITDFAAAIGRPLQDLGWHQIFAVFRSIAINVRQASIAAEAGVRYVVPAGEANPLVTVVERWIDDGRIVEQGAPDDGW